MHDFEENHLDYITENLKHYGLLARCDMSHPRFSVDNKQLKEEFLKCENEMNAIWEQAPAMDGVVSALMNRSVEKKLISQANEVIRRFNTLLPFAVREDQEKLQQYEQKIRNYELSRIQSFNPYLEYALERESLLFAKEDCRIIHKKHGRRKKILHREKYFSRQSLKHHSTIDNTEFHHSG